VEVREVAREGLFICADICRVSPEVLPEIGVRLLSLVYGGFGELAVFRELVKFVVYYGTVSG
jgi:hypothetical protein